MPSSAAVWAVSDLVDRVIVFSSNLREFLNNLSGQHWQNWPKKKKNGLQVLRRDTLRPFRSRYDNNSFTLCCTAA